MKKIIVSFVTIISLISLAACKASKESTKTPKANSGTIMDSIAHSKPTGNVNPRQ